jgi:hypothetical protein
MRLYNTTANSVACERAFHAWNLQHTKLRSSLLPDKVDQLVFLHMNYRTLGNVDMDCSEDDIEAAILEAEDEEIERLTCAFRNIDLCL